MWDTWHVLQRNSCRHGPGDEGTAEWAQRRHQQARGALASRWEAWPRDHYRSAFDQAENRQSYESRVPNCTQSGNIRTFAPRYAFVRQSDRTDICMLALFYSLYLSFHEYE